VQINVNTAKNLGIVDREVVRIESTWGSIELKVDITGDILSEVISIQPGWEEANSNLVTDDKNSDPISGYPRFRLVL
jgi:anaerobic selenocysteine-containing dehydrogenase